MSLSASAPCLASSVGSVWLLVFPFHDGDDLVLLLAGVLDASTASQFCAELADALAGHPREVLLDVSGLSACSPQGLNALDEAVRNAARSGTAVTLSGKLPQPALLADPGAG